MHTRVWLVLSVALISSFSACSYTDGTPAAVAPAAAEVAPAPVVAPVGSDPTSLAAEMTIVNPDTQLFRRTPTVDGVIDVGEWDMYYSYRNADWQVVTYADWDAKNLYVAAKSNKPIDFLNVLDASADGWFHGDENFEFKATRAADAGLSLSVCRYESRNSKAPMATPVTAAEAAMVEMKSTKSGDWSMIEMRIPVALIRGFKLTPDKKIGFQIDVKATADESGWAPTNQLGDVKECRLVTKKFATLKPLVLGFDLKDARIARGGELVGKFHLKNTGTETLDARSFVSAGAGKAGDFLSSEKIRIEGLPPKKSESRPNGLLSALMRNQDVKTTRDIRTVVPADMPTGCWALGAEVRSSSGTRLGAALVSFEVVDPFEAELSLPGTDVRADVKDVTFGVVVRNNTRHGFRGKAKIALPIGWELWKNADVRTFEVSSGGAMTTVAFKAKPPLGEMGSVPVKVDVTVNGETKSLEGKFSMVNP